MNKNKAIIVIIIIVVLTIIAAFYILNSGKTPVASNTSQALVASEKEPSETLEEYSDDAGFSFKYPSDVQINKKDVTNDPTSYADLKIFSSEVEGSISLKVLDTQLKNVDDWFLENKLIAAKEIKIGEISGRESNMNNKITAAGLDQGVLFVIEVDTQNQKYWQNVYDTILSSFSFLSSGGSDVGVMEAAPLDDSPDDAVLEEDIIE